MRDTDAGRCCAQISAVRAASWRGCCPTSPRGSASCLRAGRRRSGHRAPSPAHGGRPTCSRPPARRRPLLLVLEDGHWADTPTLLLLRHLARSAPDARMLVLATFRDTEADVPAELADTLVDLRRSDEVVRLRLGGLSDDDVTEFVRRAAGARASIPRWPSWPARSARSPRATRSCSASCGGRWSRPTRSPMTDGGAAADAAAGGDRDARQRARGRHPAPLATRRRDAAICSSSRRSPAPSSSSTCSAARRRRSSTRLDALEPAVRSGMIEEVAAPAARVPLHARARASRPVRPAERAPPRRAPPSGRRGARGSGPLARRARRSPTSHTTSPRPRRSAGRRAPSTTTCSPRAPPRRRSPTTRPPRTCESRYRSGSANRGGAPRRCSSSARGCFAPARRSTRSSRSARRPRSRASSATASC